MGIPRIDKTREYMFIEAWGKIDNNVIITSRNSEHSYKIDSFANKKKLKFFNPVIGTWQTCTYVQPEEMFDMWYITEAVDMMH